MDVVNLKSKIFYFCRAQLHNGMLEACKQAINKFNDDKSFRLYHAMALILCNEFQGSITELLSIKNEESTKLAATIALMYAYKFNGVTEKAQFAELDADMKETRKHASCVELYNASTVLYVLKKYSKALEYIEKALSLDNKNLDALTLKGWILVHLAKSNPDYSKNIAKNFNTVLEENVRYLDAFLGLIEAYLIVRNYIMALNEVNKCVVRYTSTNLPLIYKLKVQFSMQEWELAIETMNRVISTDHNCIEAMQINILILLCKDANYDEAAGCIKKFYEMIEKLEPGNGVVLIDNAQIFSRICSKNISVLSETYSMVQKAVQNSENSATFLNELAFQCYLQGKVEEAMKLYKQSTKLDSNSVDALMGLTLCEITLNPTNTQINHQIEFLLELQEHPPPFLLYMQSKVATDQELALKMLDEAVRKHLSLIENLPYEAVYLKKLDPDFILDIVEEYLRNSPYNTQFLCDIKSTIDASFNVAVPLKLLKIVVKACPGLQDAMYLLAKVQYINRQVDDATASLQRILTSSTISCNQAYLLMAQIQLENEQSELAAQNLEMCLSRDFSIRENPLYHFLQGIVETKKRESAEAIKNFDTALNLTDKKMLAERACIFGELVRTLIASGKLQEAENRLEVGLEEFQGTNQETKILVLNSDYLLAQGDIQEAIDLLTKVQPHSIGYLDAKIKLANIFLNDDMDQMSYIKCYEELANENPSPDSFLMLGDANMEILDIEGALAAYETALEMNPTDIKLIAKLGQTLVESHHFSKAVKFYEEKIKIHDNPQLKLELIDLFVNLENFEKAEKLLVAEVESQKERISEDTVSLQYKVQLLMLLSEIQENAGNLKLALSTLKEARDDHARIRNRMNSEEIAVPDNEIQRGLNIFSKLSELSIALDDKEHAINHYKDALIMVPNEVSILEKLAKLYLQMNYLELCQRTCKTIHEIDPQNETASLLMSDISFLKVDFDMAVEHFAQIVSKQKTNWQMLIRYIEVMRRTGNLEEVAQHLETVESICDAKDPGFCYCKAMYQWYSGNLNAALVNFNIARQHEELKKNAIYNMIEICLNPNGELMGEQFSEIFDSDYSDARSMALKTAERLEKELKQLTPRHSEDLRCRLISNFILLATKEKPQIERALEDLISLASQDEFKDKVGPILGISVAHTLLKQNQRAKNQLKRIAKNTWNFEEAEYLERCWLLLADYYIQSTKYDLASELLRKVVQYNKTCVKAYELLGMIAEKEQRYKEASNFYSNAWKFNGKTIPAIGYRLAYNCMKSKKFTDAIDVCYQVLKISPDYAKIKKDILEKSVSSLRM